MYQSLQNDYNQLLEQQQQPKQNDANQLNQSLVFAENNCINQHGDIIDAEMTKVEAQEYVQKRLNPIGMSNEGEDTLQYEEGQSVRWNEGNDDGYEKMQNGNNYSHNRNEPYKQNVHVNNHHRNGSPIKYVETVRGNKRNELPGHECVQCQKFYALNANLKQPKKLCNHISRHRAKHQVPCTPQHFWNIGFETQ